MHYSSDNLIKSPTSTENIAATLLLATTFNGLQQFAEF